MKKVLVVAAHPDDEVLGCGGTIARLVRQGWHARTLILGEGITARDKQRNTSKREKEILSLKEQVKAANKTLGIKEVYSYDFPDNRFDSVDLLDITKVIEKTVKEFEPSVVFTHSCFDLNKDHNITFKAVITASRPIPGACVKEIYSCEVASSTEWGYPRVFQPDVFVDITGTIKLKLEAMRQYRGELRKFPHPRSIEGIELTARKWGMCVGRKYAEAFKNIRGIRWDD